MRAWDYLSCNSDQCEKSKSHGPGPLSACLVADRTSLYNHAKLSDYHALGWLQVDRLVSAASSPGHIGRFVGRPQVTGKKKEEDMWNAADRESACHILMREETGLIPRPHQVFADNSAKKPCSPIEGMNNMPCGCVTVAELLGGHRDKNLLQQQETPLGQRKDSAGGCWRSVGKKTDLSFGLSEQVVTCLPVRNYLFHKVPFVGFYYCAWHPVLTMR